MSSSVQGGSSQRGSKKTWAITAIGVGAVLAAIAIDTTVVVVGSDQDLRQQAFDPNAYGAKEFPRIQSLVVDRAVDAVELSKKIAADKSAAEKEFATKAGVFPVFPVKFDGVVGEGKSGIFEVTIEGLPEGTVIRVQSGPAINGTELRDIPGDIEFGQFTNQIEYQNVGAGINKAMSQTVLVDLERDELTGKSVSVAGAFTMINPKNWLVTPVKFDVK